MTGKNTNTNTNTHRAHRLDDGRVVIENGCDAIRRMAAHGGLELVAGALWQPVGDGSISIRVRYCPTCGAPVVIGQEVE